MIVADERVARFVADRLGFTLCPPYTAMGVEREGTIIAGVIFNHFEGADVHVSIVGQGWTSAFLRAVGGYIYGTLDCQRMTAVTESQEVAGYALRLGGMIEGRLRNHFGYDRDALVIGILRDEWKYSNVHASRAAERPSRAFRDGKRRIGQHPESS